MASLRVALDRLYESFNNPESVSDPIHIVRRFTRPDDREIVGFCAAALAFGRVGSVLQSIERLLTVMGAHPAEYVRRFDPRRDLARLEPIVHRWIRGRDLAVLLWILRQMLDEYGSIEGFFAAGYDPSAPDLSGALDAFSRRALAIDVSCVYGETGSTERRGVCYFFPRPSTGSACKRLNLFLRWMVRQDALDLGVWTRVPPSALVVPLDTHVIRVGRCLQLTTRASPGWKMAADITGRLRELDAGDPVKYDFSICHLGMMNACGFNRAQKDAQCPLRGLCRPAASRKRTRSRQPSARR
jgi:uncharacterized protein (TIGR02757 family)